MTFLGFTTEALCELAQKGIPLERYRQPTLKEMLTVVPPEEQLIVLRLYAEKRRVASRRSVADLDSRPAMAVPVDVCCLFALMMGL